MPGLKNWQHGCTDRTHVTTGTMSRIPTEEETMSYTRNLFSREPKLSKKKRKETEQLQNVISLRISDEEKRALEKLTKSTSKSISEIMREAIDLWSSKRRKLCID